MDTPYRKTMNSKTTATQSLPPSRGRIKRGIFKGLVVMIGSMMGASGRKNSEIGGFRSSNSTPPAATPSGYYSDASADS